MTQPRSFPRTFGTTSLSDVFTKPAAGPRQTVEIPAQEVSVPRRSDILVAATDGSCRGNPGPGGWCWYVDTENWASGGEENVTNNRMELMAVHEILRATAECRDRPLLLKVDSQYTIDACTKWIHGWKRNGWMTAAKKPVANKELIAAIFDLLQGRDVRFEWVRGHSGNVLNEGADVRACAAADMVKNQRKVATYGPGLTSA